MAGGGGKTDSKEVKLEFSAFLKCGEDLNARGLINYIIKTVYFHVVNFLNDVIDGWIKKLWYICAMEYYSAIKRNVFKSVLMRQMNLEPIIQSEVS